MNIWGHILKEADAQSNDLPLLCLSSWKLSSPWSLAHISWVVPCKPPVTQNKLPSLWMGQNNTEMSLFHCNWSYLGKHKSIVSIIAMSPAPQRFFHEGSFASFHLPTDYYFHVSYFCHPWGDFTLQKDIYFNALQSVFVWVFVWYFQNLILQHFHFALQHAEQSTFDIWNTFTADIFRLEHSIMLFCLLRCRSTKSKNKWGEQPMNVSCSVRPV